ncbi:MAG: tRNA preQ1(34) S-adenosylmethionine ribosyltransferase-isomerase QueA [candidate division NC10 bacterium]|nr:tRNA preQ1(34) S-adenosylmethionine ribosyltransferase-isomerase QueA [candidate division NC10 bacterium]
MLLSHFDYDLPADLIAQEPAAERDASRLLVMDRAGGGIEHRTFLDIPEYLRAGDVLVLNDTRVLPARLFGVFDTGKSVEALLVRPVGDDCWEAMVKPAKLARIGSRLSLACGHLEATVVTLGLHGRRVLQIPSGLNLRAILDSYGVVPLPPYIKRRAESREPRAETITGGPSETRNSDRERYQTVYAREDGAVAAPTAGLHFTQALLDRIRGLGVHICPVTLHVGPGTFLPVRAEEVSQHRMESERYTIPETTALVVNTAKQEKRRVIAVGTTSVRTLEHSAKDRGLVRPGAGDADLFITPGFRFRVVDVFLTNFHLPRSTPLILVAAFASLEATRRAYQEAIARRYRFFSYGDAMLIH